MIEYYSEYYWYSIKIENSSKFYRYSIKNLIMNYIWIPWLQNITFETNFKSFIDFRNILACIISPSKEPSSYWNVNVFGSIGFLLQFISEKVSDNFPLILYNIILCFGWFLSF